MNMARKKKKTANVRREATGILMQALWVLLLLALVSYTWKDIPWECSPANSPTANYIGPVGAWTAWGLFKVFGLVGFVFPLVMAVWGILMIVQSAERVWPRVLWMLAILSGLCVLVDIQADFWNEVSAARLNLSHMPGGFIGYFLGRLFLTNYLGLVGAAIICVGVVVGGLFFVSQTHPKELLAAVTGIWERMQAQREEWAAGRRSAQQQAERESMLVERERAKLMREMEKERRIQEKEDRRREKEDVRLARDEERQAKEEERQAKAEARRLDVEAQRRQREEADAAREQEEAQRKAVFMKRLKEQKKAEEDKHAADALALKNAQAASTQTAEEEADQPPPKWVLPPMTLLQPIPEGSAERIGADELENTTKIIRNTLAEFGIEAEVTHVEQGPVVTRYELLPAAGVKVEKIGTYAGNLALALKAESIRVQAPIPGKGVVGVEVPNRKPVPVVLRQLLQSAKWATSKAALPLALGQDVGGHILMADLAKLPHLLIAGATGQGKTVCMNSILAGLLSTQTPDQLRLILIDPKIVEFSGYNDLPHLLVPVITEAKKVVSGLRWAIQEMEKRFKLFHKARVRDIISFNERPKVEQPELFQGEASEEAASMEPPPAPKPDPDALPDTLPYIVIIIDELADLMLTAQQDIEPQVQKLTQLARATGIHMIIATQRPTVNIITGTIKSNIPGRIAFKVAQKNDSRVILDQEGADKLVGKGDMLVVAGTNKIQRAQGAWTKDEEIQVIAEHWKQQGKPRFESALQAKMEGKGGVGLPEMPEEDEELIQQAIEVIRQTRRASTSSIQRRLRIGYTRAARVIDILEDKGMVGPPRGSEAREILFDLDGFDSPDMESDDEETLQG